MEEIFLKLVNRSIAATYLVLAVLAVRLVFQKTPKWILCALWGMVAFRLICPFPLESALSLVPSAEPLPSEIIYTAQPEIQSGIPALDEVMNPVLESSLTPGSPADSVNPTQVWSFLLSRLWVLGLVLMCLYTLVSYLLIYRRVATAIPVAKGIKRSEFVDTPFVLGLIAPVIYLPACMDEQDIPYVIAHEQAHIRRRDHWWKPIGFLLLSIFWFNPVMWLSYILLCRDIEAACDEKVIQDMTMDGRRAYAAALLKCSIQRGRITACPLAFGEAGVKVRVKGVMNYRKPAFWVIVTVVALVCVIAVCFLTNPEQELQMTAKDITPKGMTLSFSPKDFDRQKIERCWLETMDGDGTWSPVDTLGTRIPVGADADAPVLFTSSGNQRVWEVDFSCNYGFLLPGGYRIGVAYHDPKNKETRISYAQFPITSHNTAYVWFNLDDSHVSMPREKQPSIRIPGAGGTVIERSKTTDFTQALVDRKTGATLISGQRIHSAVFADLSGDGVCEVYAAVEEGNAVRIHGYDFSTGKHLSLQSDTSRFDTLAVRQDCLFVLKKDTPVDFTFEIVECGQMGLTKDGKLKALPLDARSQPLTRQVEGIEIWGPNVASVHAEQIPTMMSLLRNLEGNVTKAPTEVLAEAKDDSLHFLSICISYALGQRVIHVTQDCGLVWEDGRNEGFYLTDPEPLRGLVSQVYSENQVIHTVAGRYEWQKPVKFQYENVSVKLWLIEGWDYETVSDLEKGYTGIRCRPGDVDTGWITFSYWPDGYVPEEYDRLMIEGSSSDGPFYTSYPSSVGTPNNYNIAGSIWSYRRTVLQHGDYVVINEGADDWFLTYEKQIETTELMAEIQWKEF